MLQATIANFLRHSVTGHRSLGNLVYPALTLERSSRCHGIPKEDPVPTLINKLLQEKQNAGNHRRTSYTERENLDKNRNQRSTRGDAGDVHLPRNGEGAQERARSAQALPSQRSSLYTKGSVGSITMQLTSGLFQEIRKN